MNPLLNSCLSVLFLIFGAGAVVIMLELKGNPTDRLINSRLIRTHRLPGYGFVALFNKCGKRHTFERTFRATKDQDGWTKTINRMAVIDAPNINDFDVKQIIYFLLEQQKQREEKLDRQLNRRISQTLISQKCSLCHDLDRVFKANKSKDQWQLTVKKMTTYSGDPTFLSTKEIADIITYLAERNTSTAAAD